MDGLVYLIWVSIPISLVLLALLSKLRQVLIPTDADNPNRPRRILRLANAFAFFTVACVAIDQFFFQGILGEPASRWHFDEQELRTFRFLLLPIVAMIGFFMLLILRALRPRSGFDRVRMEVQGSSPLILLTAFITLAMMVWDRGAHSGPDQKKDGHSSLEPKIETEQEGKEKTPSWLEERGKDFRAFASQISRNSADFIDELRAIAGMPSSPSYRPTPLAAPTLPPGARPDFNSEGNLVFGPLAEQVAELEGVDPLLARSIVEIASGYNLRWESSEHHRGLMGLIPERVTEYGDRDLFNAHENLKIGCRELKRALAREKGDLARALTIFRLGLSNETTSATPEGEHKVADFVSRVLATYRIASARGTHQ